MKGIAIAATLTLTALNLFAQGAVEIVFTSHTTSTDNHIWGSSSNNPSLSLVGSGSNDSPPGSTPYQTNGMLLIGTTGSPYSSVSTFAQLLVAPGSGQSESSLRPATPVTTFRSGAYAGQIAPVTVTPFGIPPDVTSITVEGVAWDNSSGQYSTWTQASAAWLAGAIAAGKAGPSTLSMTSGSFTYVLPSFNLYFTLPPAILSNPKNVPASPGGTAILNAVTTNASSYQWFFGGASIAAATNSTLVLTNLRTTQAGSYFVVVSNSGGSATSTPAILSLLSLKMYGGLTTAGLTIAGQTGDTYRVDYRQTLVGTNWTTLTNFVLPTSPFLLLDTNSAYSSRRFYRAVVE